MIAFGRDGGGHDLSDVIVAKLVWKSGVMRDYAAALLLAAVELRTRGTLFFNNDDVCADAQPLDKTTVGAVFRMLADVGVIERYLGTNKDLGILGGQRKSSRKECRGHMNALWTLVSVPMAREWLQRNGYTVRTGQAEFSFFEPTKGTNNTEFQRLENHDT